MIGPRASFLGVVLTMIVVRFQTFATSKRLMYVWNKEFRARDDTCGIEEAKTEQPASCFESVRAERLSRACKRADVDRVLYSFPQDALERCDDNVIETLRTLHGNGVKIYQLYAASTPSFPEIEMVSHVSTFNEKCAKDETETFDGVAVNNEAFQKCCDETCDSDAIQRMVSFVNSVRLARDRARPLPFHFSIAWHWGVCGPNNDPLTVTYEGVTQSVTKHLIDIADSTDVQVAWSEATEMVRRAKIAGYDRVREDGTYFVLAYTNAVPNDDCRLTFFPYETACAVGESTERGLFSELSKIEAALPHASGGIHYYSNAYFSGLPGWGCSKQLRHGIEGNRKEDDTQAPLLSSGVGSGF